MADETDLALERILDAPRDLVWRAWTSPEHLKLWWAPKPYETPECEMDLRPGGRFYTRMTGPDGFDFRGTGCFLEVVEGERITWTSALGEDYRPNDLGPSGCGAFPFTAIVTLADAGEAQDSLPGGRDARQPGRPRCPRQNGLPRRLGQMRRAARRGGGGSEVIPLPAREG
jgi:uncharacterized protein YndB with AHSA1/START domain